MFLERSLNDPHPPPLHFKHPSLLPPSPSTTPLQASFTATPPHPPPLPPLKILIVHLVVYGVRQSFTRTSSDMIVEAQLQLSQICAHRFEVINVSVSSKPDHLPGDPQGFALSHFPGVRFFPNFLCPGGRGIEFEKFSTVLKENCRKFSICFKETRGSLISRCSWAVSYQFLQKQ